MVSVGTGGSITGIGRYFKERKPEVLIVGVDPEGSIYTADAEHPVGPYLVEGIGKDAWPETMDPGGRRPLDPRLRSRLVPHRPPARARGGAPRRRLVRVDRLGGAAARAELGPGARILMTFPDGGRSYLSKFHDEEWMNQYGFVERSAPQPTVEEVLRFKHGQHDGLPELVTIGANMKIGAAIDLMQRYSISQLPVVRTEPPTSVTDVIGSLQERGVLERVFRNADALSEDVAVAMQPPFGTADVSDTLDRVFQDLSGRREAVLVARGAEPIAILTRSDLLEFLAARRFQVQGRRHGGFALSRRTVTITAPTISTAPAAVSAVGRSSRIAAPRMTATSGLTYWCVTTCEIGATPRSQA